MTPEEHAPIRPAAAHAGSRARVAMAFAGGGPLGAIYEIGALCALEESLDGLDVLRCDHYVGVSAGGFLAASLANGIGPRALVEAFIEGRPGELRFDPDCLMTPAWREWGRSARRLPALLARAGWAWFQGRPLTQALEQLGAAMPTGVFDNEAIHTQLARVFEQPGRTNDFRRLRSRLTLVATQLDTGDAAPFGQPGWDHVPISRAIQASAALPGLFPPVAIDGCHYVDGALKKTLHATVALDEGVDLLLCVNPLVPFRANPQAPQAGHIPAMVEGGFPAVMSQTFRSMIHSRLELGFKHYETAYPHTDLVLIEPDPCDAELFFANTFSYRQRREMAEHAYQQTRHWLRRQAPTLGPRLARHGVRLDLDALQDTGCHLLTPRPRHTPRLATRLHATLDALQQHLPATPSAR